MIHKTVNRPAYEPLSSPEPTGVRTVALKGVVLQW